MAMDRAQLLKKIAGSSMTSGGNNFRDGRGRVAVKKLSLEDGWKGSRFVGEFVVLSSHKIPVTELKTGKTLEIEPNPPGSEVSWVQMFDMHPNAFGSTKQLVLELYGERPEDNSEEEIINTLDDVTKSNSAFGMVIDYETYRKVTKEKGIEVVLVKWRNVEQTPQDIANTRAYLESLVTGAKTATEAPATN